MKNILITGVCGGMGYAAARQFTGAGFRVFGIDRRPSCDLPIDYFCADITDHDSIDEVCAKISAETGKLDAVLHFAGIYNLDSLIEISEEEFVRIFNINLFGIYRVNKAFVPMLDKGGRIVITSSELAPLDPLPFTGLYAITKSAVEKYAYSLRMELNLHGISVSVIRPGAVRTGMLGVSTAALEDFCQKTKRYSYNAVNFRRVVDSVETRNVTPEKIAETAFKAVTARRPKYVYNINRNPLLRLLNVLPKRMQVWIITKILK
ncbi:MAG: SDR family NAD(P)-dependent oxidoreductase [Eubacteriales bacterium]